MQSKLLKMLPAAAIGPITYQLSNKYGTQSFSDSATPIPPQKDQVTFNRFGLTREQLIDGTHFVNKFSAAVLFAGYGSSLVHGAATILGKPDIANIGLHGARIAYNAQTAATSGLRFATTNDKGRENDDARYAATVSNIASAISVGHGVVITAGRFIPSVLANPYIGAFRDYSKTSAFNATAGFGTTAAWQYNKSEYRESEHKLQSIEYEIGIQSKVPKHQSDAAVRANVPHITRSEYVAKNISYSLGNIAAVGGLMTIPEAVIKPNFPKIYEQMVQSFGTQNLAKAARFGGVTNGVGYAVASVVYPVLVSDNYTSKDRRTSREKGEEWDPIHENGLIQGAILGLGLVSAAAIMALRHKHPNNIIIKNLAPYIPKFEGKADCVAGVTFGTFAVAMHAISNRREPQVADLLKDPGQSRRWWAGPRMAYQGDVLEYIKNTDPALSAEEIDRNLRKLASKVNSTKNLKSEEELAKMSTEEIRNLLENGKYEKQLVNERPNGNDTIRVMAEGDAEDSRLFWPGAHYAAAIRSDIARGKYAEKDKTMMEKVGEVLVDPMTDRRMRAIDQDDMFRITLDEIYAESDISFVQALLRNRESSAKDKGIGD